MKDKLLQVLYKFDMSKEDCRIDNALEEILSLIKENMPKKKTYYGDNRDTELTSEYDQGYAKGWDSAIDACMKALTERGVI